MLVPLEALIIGLRVFQLLPAARRGWAQARGGLARAAAGGQTAWASGCGGDGPAAAELSGPFSNRGTWLIIWGLWQRVQNLDRRKEKCCTDFNLCSDLCSPKSHGVAGHSTAGQQQR